MPVEMVIHALGQSPQSGEPLILLRESGGERFLVIGIGPLEIMGIAAALSGTPPPRPMTHDLLCSAISACGARVTDALIHGIIDGAFHARLGLDVQGRRTELDSRSSDAIAIAVRTGIPIMVEETVLDQAGVRPEPGGTGGAEPEPQERISEEQLGAFRDVISGLNLDDLGRPEGGR